ncbi:hypothetical protein JOF53_000701 [Crossiella equi]|uniref:DUF1918 domain-containing protein n=1 Tax=Crossiella equi TaxID=130796 RepID=A0ABS5A5F5_9PSEU|nr:DUF1918 domain-containing protein [Crossiella equi]MBP2471829.1 hypothetical protein [Crossiella equi]
MHAETGDWLVVKGATIGAAGRRGQVVALVHPDGTPPYHVRWLDTGRTSLVFPGPDAHIEPRTAAPVA